MRVFQPGKRKLCFLRFVDEAEEVLFYGVEYQLVAGVVEDCANVLVGLYAPKTQLIRAF